MLATVGGSRDSVAVRAVSAAGPAIATIAKPPHTQGVAMLKSLIRSLATRCMPGTVPRRAPVARPPGVRFPGSYYGSGTRQASPEVKPWSTMPSALFIRAREFSSAIW
ncbi:hypothetical protein Amsp01_054150 [Amycolatopsis sp. NBRC 101858]|nr:hypothetical protein Amsp01_054150 [Amycolatopsis sp. NBRC 101858]